MDGVVEHVESRDGTRIGYRKAGVGPALVLLHGTTGAHWSFTYLAPLLVDRFTLYAVDRRGRGESGDAEEYTLEREFEDAAAVLDSIDGPASVFGHSFGATVALGAALLARDVHRLVLYEGSPGLEVGGAELGRVDDLVAQGRPDDALAFALEVFGLTSDEIEQMRGLPSWPARVAAAHTVAREARAEEAYSPDSEALRRMIVPVLFLLGEESPDWAREGTEKIHAMLPDARIAILRGQGHAATLTAPELVADEVVRFLGE